MNEPRVRAVQVYNGWEGHFRKIHRSGWHAVQVNGVVQLYPTEADAKLAAYEAMTRHHFGDGILRDGEKMSADRSLAEKLFNKVFPGKGKKPVEVERR